MNPRPGPIDTPQATRPVLPGMRVLLTAFAVLTALAVGTLFVLAETTARTFAWTIQPPLTAAFLGAGYAAGFLLVVLSLREGVWANTRLPVLTILVFVVLTLTATLLHVNRLHFDDEFGGSGALARGAAWFWLVVYIVVPPAMVALLVQQERAPGSDPPARHPIPPVLRAALAVESAVLLVVGVLLFVDPATATWLWPWELTPFTARIVAAWLFAFGLATALAAVGGDLARLRTAAIAYPVFGVLVAVSVLRFPGTIDWDRPAAWVLVAMTAAMVATGVTGWWIAPTPVSRNRG